MAFERFLFGLALNGLSVAKYTGKQTIKLVVERNGQKAKGFFSQTFKSADEYEDYMDHLVSDYEAVYNQASALNKVLNSLRCK